MGIVEVNVPGIHSNGSGFAVDTVDKLQRSRLDRRGILRVFPGPRELGHHHGLVAIASEIWYRLLEKWGMRDDRGGDGLQGHGPYDTRAVADGVAGVLPEVVGAM